MGDGDEEIEGRRFERRSKLDLDRLTDAALLAYLAAAREAGHRDAERDAVEILVNGFWPQIVGWVSAKTPREDVDDVAQEVVISLMRSTFDGKAIGQFGAFVRTIAKRRVADYHRDRERHPDPDRLPSEHRDDEDVWGEEPSDEDETAVVELREVVERVRATRSEVHREVIALYGPNVAGFLDLSGEETAARIQERFPGEKMSEANVHQIWKRFKTDLEAELGDDV